MSAIPDIQNIRQGCRAYFKWLNRNAASFPSKQIEHAAETCGLHLKTIERMAKPPVVVVESAQEAFAKLERLLGEARRADQ